MKILADVCNYTRKHTVALLDGKKVISEMNVPIDEVEPAIEAYVNGNSEVDEVLLMGGQTIAQKYKDDLSKATCFDKKDIKITIL